MSFLQPLAVEQRSEPSEASAIQNESGKARYEPNEGASDAPESGQKMFLPKDMQKFKKIRKIKMSF